MTAYSMTVTNSVRAFGGSPASLWNAYNWNAFTWGEGTATIPKNIVHLFTDTLSPTSARGFLLKKLLTGQTLSLDSARSSYGLQRLISAGNLTITADMASETLQDSSGYDYVYPGNVTNAHNRISTSWSESSSSSAGWSTSTVTSTTWSNA